MPENTQAPWSITDRILNVGIFAKVAGQELFEGIRRDRIPAHLYCYPGIASALAIMLHVDEIVLRHFHPGGHIPHAARHALIYSLLFSGWIIWAVEQAGKRNRLLARLQSAFEAAKLKCNNTYPSLLEDVAIDEHVRKLRLKANGVTISEIEAGKEKLETILNTTIIRVIAEEGDKGRVDIIYADQDLPKKAHLENPDRYADALIPIGLTHEGPLAINLREVGHILVAGQTGGGKSNYLKLVTSILAIYNPEAEVFFLDFKGGMESADLKNEIGNSHENTRYFDGTHRCIQELSQFGGILDQRLALLAKNGFSSLDEYRKAQLARKSDAANGREDQLEKRIFVVIDELSQLYVKDPDTDQDLAKKAKAALNRIARQGRAAGIHLIAATQKPDSSSFDQTVKANLPGVLCFPMTTQAASVSALGTKRAFELDPATKGRAVWKFGPKIQEVQTYLFT